VYSMSANAMARRQGVFWLLTIPESMFEPKLPSGCAWIKGQKEEGGTTGYRHWQVIVALQKKGSIAAIKSIFGNCHGELSRSEAANEYVWKEDTRVEGTCFEFGAKPIRRNSRVDWDSVWESAKSGNLCEIPANVRVVSYRTLRAIGSDFSKAQPMERTCYVFWGKTGTGKSRRAWDEAGMEAYSKDPRTKFWDGYQSEQNVVIDEFRGGIDIAHMLRWLDRYPVRVEIKGSSRPLVSSKIWITSNISPESWYPEADQETVAALLRRLQVTEFN